MISAAAPEENGCCAVVEVDHVLFLEADLASEVLAHDALPGGVELLIKLCFEFFRELHVCDVVVATLLRKTQFYELNSFELHVYRAAPLVRKMCGSYLKACCRIQSLVCLPFKFNIY